MQSKQMQRFSDKARQALGAAQASARQMQHPSINVNHLLLALVELHDSAAQKILANVGLSPEAVRAHLAELPADPDAAVTPRLSPDLKRVLEFAVNASRRWRHPYVGTEHLLLALAQYNHAMTRRLLETTRADGDRLRQRVESMFEAGILQEQPPASRNPAVPESVEAVVEQVTQQVVMRLEPDDWKALARIATKIANAMRDAVGPYQLLLLRGRHDRRIMAQILEELLRRAQVGSGGPELHDVLFRRKGDVPGAGSATDSAAEE